MRLEVRAIKNRLCGARNKNIKNIGKNNGLLNETEKGECGPKSMGQNGVESHLGDSKSAHGPTYKQMPNNPGEGQNFQFKKSDW